MHYNKLRIKYRSHYYIKINNTVYFILIDWTMVAHSISQIWVLLIGSAFVTHLCESKTSTSPDSCSHGRMIKPGRGGRCVCVNCARPVSPTHKALLKTMWLNSNAKQEYYKYFWQRDPPQFETQESCIAQHTLSVSINSENTWESSTSVSSVIIWWEHDCDSCLLSSICWTNEWKPYKAIMLFLAIITNRYFLLRY